MDTHPIHTHLFTAQIITRVGQDGQVASGSLAVDPNDVGWKETFKVNPLEITFVALRPTVPTPSQIPFELPNSVRLIDPMLPEGATLPPPGPAGWFDPNGNPLPEILNHYVNFGWEYVWHCHILSHEEMDFMHSLVFAVPPRAPMALTAAATTGNNPTVSLIWTDNSSTELQFRIERATNGTFTSGLTTFVYVNPNATTPNQASFTDTNVVNGTVYWYRVVAVGETVGDVSTAGFPTMSADSVSNTFSLPVGTPPGAPAAPTGLTALVQANPAGGAQVRLRWTDTANNETSFALGRCTGVGCGLVAANFAQIATVPPRTTGSSTVTYFDTTVTPGNTYNYQVTAVNSAGASSPSPVPTAVVAAVVPAIPAAPTGFTVSAVKANGNNYTATLNWVAAVSPANFTIQRANNLDFTTGLTTFTPAGIARTLIQTVAKNTVYYYRIRANNGFGGSSVWTNALPFPLRTGQ